MDSAVERRVDCTSCTDVILLTVCAEIDVVLKISSRENFNILLTTACGKLATTNSSRKLSINPSIDEDNVSISSVVPLSIAKSAKSVMKLVDVVL